jgi:hypothetical protein
MGELSSMIPTAGGQYHWVSLLAPASSRKFLSYITGQSGWDGICLYRSIADEADGGRVDNGHRMGCRHNGYSFLRELSYPGSNGPKLRIRASRLARDVAPLGRLIALPIHEHHSQQSTSCY